MYRPGREQKSFVTLLYGPPGCGKTYWCQQHEGTKYWKQPSTQWWDGYTGQEITILDEFRGWLPFSNLLRLLDAYPLTVEVKGGQVAFTSDQIFLTCNHHPMMWYDKEKVGPTDLKALGRRIDTVYFFDGSEVGKFHELSTEERVEWLNLK